MRTGKMRPQLRGDETLRSSDGACRLAPLAGLAGQHEMGGGCLCHEHRHGDPAFVGSQDAWFDSKPDEMDDKYIKWRDRPSTCIPCAPTAVASLKPAAASEQPPQQEPTESFKSPASQELQITPVVEAKPTAAPELQPPQQDPIESKSPANQELQIGMSEKFADHVGQSDFMHV